jgi:hypothetical protein
MFSGADVSKAVVYRDNKECGEFSLRESRVVNIEGTKMQLEIKDGHIRVLKSDCPKGVCVHQGFAGCAGESIVCLPNKMLVEIQSNNGSLDAVAR